MVDKFLWVNIVHATNYSVSSTFGFTNVYFLVSVVCFDAVCLGDRKGIRPAQNCFTNSDGSPL